MYDMNKGRWEGRNDMLKIVFGEIGNAVFHPPTY